MKTIAMVALLGSATGALAQETDPAGNSAATSAGASATTINESVASQPGADAGIIPPPPAGQGEVVFFRRGTIIGAAISCAVSENGKKLSSLPPGKYAVVTVEPGVHEFTVSSEATDRLRLEVEPDEIYYAKCSIGFGVMAGRPNLSPADKPAFDALRKKLKPVKKA